MIKTMRVYRDAPPEEDYSWALAMDENERLEIAYRLVCDLWSATHHGEPYPDMDRSNARFVLSPQTPCNDISNRKQQMTGQRK